ncbi:MAG: hypothetical protein EBX40_03030 [Gammaproteobacteria bacterium]|nr:hypothetical protein [Gammaproteobacteria bacterium]
MNTADDGPIKPHPDALLRAMELTGVGPVDTLAVGDTARDMQMARNAGVTALGVTYGILDKNQLIQAGAHATLDNIQHLPLWLKGEKT